jgi:hypothetical protein
MKVQYLDEIDEGKRTKKIYPSVGREKERKRRGEEAKKSRDYYDDGYGNPHKVRTE